MLVCPLDCWDVCQMRLVENKFKATSFSKFLCYKLNNYFKFKKENNAFYKGKIISLDKAKQKIVQILNSVEPKKVLFLKGSGNLGNMPNITKLFFERFGATFAYGSTCDGIGEIGFVKSIGASLNLPANIIKNAKNIVLWGRNVYETNIHLIPLIKNKNKICIDVIETKTAINSDLFLQIKPKSDYFLAILLSQILIEQNLAINTDGNNFEKFKKIVFSYKQNELLEKIGLSLDSVKKFLDILVEGSVILMGLGVAKCKECYKTTWAINSLAKLLDYFGKNDKGVAFLGSSNFNLLNPFKINPKNKVALFDIDLDDFEVVFIQGANPLVSLVNQNFRAKLKEKIVINFGKFLDESAKIATLFLPTKDFYAKKDVRGSYFHEFVLVNEPAKDDLGISEYELTNFLFNEFNFSGLKDEDFYINEFLKNCKKVGEGIYLNKIYEKIPFEDGFYTKDKKFNFLDEDFIENKSDFFVVTAKETKALNSQFKRENFLRINPNSKKIIQKFKNENIVFDEKIPINIVYAKGGSIINKYLNATGENAYYENL